jgi:phosphoribosylaminoimidazolecarboxamide formyltransferase/IMP cyclohydrolase
VPVIRRALISVSDKRGIVDFARALRSLGVEIISTGGTHTALHSAGIEARTVSSVTGFPEILDGRVKTLHPAIHAALLAVTDNEEHNRQIAELGITPIDMVVVNLYPFRETVARPQVTREEAIEQIDIGGPSLLRAAAKNYRHKAVVSSPDSYGALLEEMRSKGGGLGEETCFHLACEAFRHTSSYDAAISAYLDRTAGSPGALPASLTITAPREFTLRYGENPHQQAALYGSFSSVFRKLHGKELSFNNIMDISAAALLVAEFDEPTVVIVKHTNPCGVGSASSLVQAYEKAFATDTKSAYGGIIAVNRPLDAEAAERMNETFTEVIVAPDFPPAVLEFLRKKRDRRLVHQVSDLRTLPMQDIKSVPGGFLLQQSDFCGPERAPFRVVTRRQPTEEESRALHFAWRVVKHVKSNAIVYTTDDRTIGIGAGQMSRVDSARIAALKATESGLSLEGTAVGSDAFFPFPDALLEVIRAGATAVAQPGGSIHDDEVIRAADEKGIAMVFTGTRHFRH